MMYIIQETDCVCATQDQMQDCVKRYQKFFMISFHLAFSNSHGYNSASTTAKGHYTKYNNQNRNLCKIGYPKLLWTATATALINNINWKVLYTICIFLLSLSVYVVSLPMYNIFTLREGLEIRMEGLRGTPSLYLYHWYWFSTFYKVVEMLPLHRKHFCSIPNK